MAAANIPNPAVVVSAHREAGPGKVATIDRGISSRAQAMLESHLRDDHARYQTLKTTLVQDRAVLAKQLAEIDAIIGKVDAILQRAPVGTGVAANVTSAPAEVHKPTRGRKKTVRQRSKGLRDVVMASARTRGQCTIPEIIQDVTSQFPDVRYTSVRKALEAAVSKGEFAVVSDRPKRYALTGTPPSPH